MNKATEMRQYVRRELMKLWEGADPATAAADSEMILKECVLVEKLYQLDKPVFDHYILNMPPPIVIIPNSALRKPERVE